MNITMLQSVSSLAGSYSCKKSYEVPDILAKQWIAAGYAKATVAAAPAVVAPPVKAPEVAPVAAPVEKPTPAPTNAPAPAQRAKGKPSKSDLL
jgi:hypothetical protein